MESNIRTTIYKNKRIRGIHTAYSLDGSLLLLLLFVFIFTLIRS